MQVKLWKKIKRGLQSYQHALTAESKAARKRKQLPSSLSLQRHRVKNSTRLEKRQEKRGSENSLQNNHQRGQGRLSRAASSLLHLLKSLDSVTPPLGSQGQEQRRECSSSSPADPAVSGASVNSLHPFNILQTGHWKRECLFAGLVRHCIPRKELISRRTWLEQIITSSFTSLL